MKADISSVGGKIVEGDADVGTVQEWVVGERISLLWHPKTWEKETTNKLVITFTAIDGGTRVMIEQQEWGRVLADEGEELLGWFASEVVAPMLSASTPSRLGDWITDRNARRPSGGRSRGFYRNPTYHWPNFYAILEVIALGPRDHLLEVGCGGGAFLHEALKTGCRASAIDHSPDMVRLATEANRDAINDSRLEVTTGKADALPYPDGTFTCAVMTGVLGFLPDPLKAFREVLRVLSSGGRFVVYTGSKELRGTPAAPEPMASRLNFYEDDEIERIALLAGFTSAKVVHPSLFEYAKKAGVPASDLNLFKGDSSSQLLVAQKA